MSRKTRIDNIDEYNQNPNFCKNCGKPIIAKYDDILANIKQKKFCNNSCSASFNNANSLNRPKAKFNLCLNCGILKR